MLRKEKGFTLIELLVVVLIIGILAAAAIPKLLSAVNNARCGRTVSDIGAINSAIVLYTVNSTQQPAVSSTDVSDFLSPDYMPSKTNPWAAAYLYTGTASDYTIETTISADCSVPSGQVCASGAKIVYNAGVGDFTCG